MTDMRERSNRLCDAIDSMIGSRVKVGITDEGEFVVKMDLREVNQFIDAAEKPRLDTVVEWMT